MKRTIVAALLCALAPALCFAQEDPSMRRPSVFSDFLNAQAPGNFLSVPGLSFQSSVGYSYVSGGGDLGSFGMGYYMGHFGLQLSRNLTLRWDVGVGTVTRNAGEYSSPEIFLPNVDLTYRPSENFSVRLQFNQYRYPGYYQYRR
jgi:hypothetical protein